jgi:hypothetical protein
MLTNRDQGGCGALADIENNLQRIKNNVATPVRFERKGIGNRNGGECFIDAGLSWE